MKKLLFLTILLVAGFSCVSFAQFRMSIGPHFGMNYNFYHGTAIDNSNMSYNGIGMSAGGQMDMSFTPVLGMLVTATIYDLMSAKGSITQQNVKQVNSISLAYLTINPAMKFSIPRTGLAFFAGPGIGFKLTGKGETYQIANGQRQQLAPKSDIMNTRLRITGQIGTSDDFDLKSLCLTPYFLFDYGFTNVDESDSWKASGIKFGLVLKFGVVK
jgi:hypothetical protein